MKPTAFRIASFMGILLLLCAIVLLIVNPHPQHNLPAGFHTPIIALEFIQTPAEVSHFFDVKDPVHYEQTLLLGNLIDYGFMFLYSGLLLCITIGIKKLTGMNSLYIAMLFCAGMLAGDALENYQIFRIIMNYKQGDITDALNYLSIFTWMKWGCIASVFLILSPFFWKGTLFHKLIGCCSILCFALCITAFFYHGFFNELFSTSVVVVFLLLVIFVFTYRPAAVING